MAAIRRCSPVLAAIALYLITTGCNLQPMNVWVYIDNAGNQPLVVTVDGKEAATIEPGEFAKLEYPPGEYRFHIRSGDEVLCDLTRKLEKSEDFLTARKYLFNPDKFNRYISYEAQYGVNRLDGVMQNTMLKFQKDETIRRQFIYKQLLKEIDVVPSDAWNDVSDVQYVLTEPPNMVMTRHGRSSQRTVLDRLEVGDYERLVEAAKNTEPTEADIERLSDLIEEILDNAL